MTKKKVTVMYESIFYKICKKTIEIGEKVYPLGKLTAEVLNITPQEHEKMQTLLEQAEEELSCYTDTLDLSHWKSANDCYLELDAMLCTRELFRLLKQKPSVLEEAQTLFADLEELKVHDFELTEDDYKILNAMNLYEEYLQNPNAFGGETYWEATDVRTGERYQYSRPKPRIPAPPPPKTKNLLIAPGDLELKLAVYKQVCAGYRNALDDIASFNMTIHNFINLFLSKLHTLNPNNYAAALHDFLNHPNAEKWIANPFRGTGFYTNADNVTMRFVPKEDSNGDFQIYEYYEAKNLQIFLKMDFYRGLGAGHIIRRCQCCGRYFMLEKGYHTKYCDMPYPDDPRHTCRQIGYRNTGMKEAAKDNPLKQSLLRCYQRLNQDVSRGNLTSEERDILYTKAEELYFDARKNPNVRNEDFEKFLATKNLCKLCGIERKSGRVGRPKKK